MRQAFEHIVDCRDYLILSKDICDIAVKIDVDRNTL